MICLLMSEAISVIYCLSINSAFDRARRAAYAHHTRLQVRKYAAARSNNHLIKDADPGGYIYICCNPAFIADGYGAASDGKARILIIVISGAKIGPLRDHGITADIDFSETIQNDIVANPYTVAQGDFPGVGDGGRRPDHGICTDTRSKQAQKRGPEAVGDLGRASEQCRLR